MPGQGQLTPLNFGVEVRSCIWRVWKSTCHVKPKFHWARHVTSRHDSTRSICRVCRASRARRVDCRFLCFTGKYD